MTRRNGILTALGAIGILVLAGLVVLLLMRGPQQPVATAASTGPIVSPNDPDAGFRTAFIGNGITTCTAKARAAADQAGHAIADATIKDYCTCSLQHIGQALTHDEVAQMEASLPDIKVPDTVQGKIQAGMQQCRPPSG